MLVPVPEGCLFFFFYFSSSVGDCGFRVPFLFSLFSLDRCVVDLDVLVRSRTCTVIVSVPAARGTGTGTDAAVVGGAHMMLCI